MSNGKKFDVLTEDINFTNQRTGLEYLADHIFVHADAGCKDVILSVEGVRDVYNTFGPTQYSVYLDPRYDRDFVKREIEAAILCRSQP